MNNIRSIRVKFCSFACTKRLKYSRKFFSFLLYIRCLTSHRSFVLITATLEKVENLPHLYSLIFFDKYIRSMYTINNIVNTYQRLSVLLLLTTYQYSFTIIFSIRFNVFRNYTRSIILSIVINACQY